MRLPLPVFQAPLPRRYSHFAPASMPLTAIAASLVMRSSAVPVSLISASVGAATVRSRSKVNDVEAWLPATSVCRTSTVWRPSTPNSVAAMRSPLPVCQAPLPRRYSHLAPVSMPLTATAASLVMRSPAVPVSLTSATVGAATVRSTR